MPDEDRVRYLDLHFVHRFLRPAEPDGTTLVLLHGTGGNEADLMPLASKIAPRSTLLGIRGRSTEEQTLRWFIRTSATTFDQADIRSEAEAFAAFVEEMRDGYRMDPEKLIFVGYSNGANFLAATMLLHPGLIKRAILLRPSMVLLDPPDTDLSASQVALIFGDSDRDAGRLPSPESVLRERGARIVSRTLPAGHALADADIDAAKEALAEFRRSA